MATTRRGDEAYAALGEAYGKDAFDDGDLDDAYDAIADANAAIEAEARKTLAEIHEHLSADQRDIVARLVSRDGPASLFDKKSRGVPDRKPGAKKKQKKDGRKAGKGERREGKAERREAKRAARREAKGLDGKPVDPEAAARAKEMRRQMKEKLGGSGIGIGGRGDDRDPDEPVEEEP